MADTVRVAVKRPTGTGRRAGWYRVVTDVDDTKSNGYAFDGPFLDERQVDLEIGSMLVGRIPVGSARSGFHWRAGVVGAGGVAWEEKTWPDGSFLDFRDHVKGLLSPEDETVALREERTRLLERIEQIDLRIEQAGRG